MKRWMKDWITDWTDGIKKQLKSDEGVMKWMNERKRQNTEALYIQLDSQGLIIIWIQGYGIQ